MKKKGLFIVIGLTILLGVLFLAWDYYRYTPGFYVHGVVEGNSMSEYGFHDGDATLHYINEVCEVGDFCEFTCIAEKCALYDEYPTSVKLLTNITDDCYYFEGNKNPWREEAHPGKIGTSHDSNVFGCLMPDEFEMHGVVRK